MNKSWLKAYAESHFIDKLRVGTRQYKLLYAMRISTSANNTSNVLNWSLYTFGISDSVLDRIHKDTPWWKACSWVIQETNHSPYAKLFRFRLKR